MPRVSSRPPPAGPDRPDRRPLAVILARGGSKRLPGKNIRPLGGSPLICRTIATLLATDLFSRVLVSTDSLEIADMAQKAGAWVPFQRPPELASDQAGSLDALLHAVTTAMGLVPLLEPEYIGLFQPTSPFLTPRHVTDAFRELAGEGFTTLSSMCAVTEPPAWMFRADDRQRLHPFQPGLLTCPSQDLPVLYRENGALFLVETAYLLEFKSLYNIRNHGMFLMSREESLDIDTPLDWDFAEFLLERRSGGPHPSRPKSTRKTTTR